MFYGKRFFFLLGPKNFHIVQFENFPTQNLVFLPHNFTWSLKL